MTLVIPNLQRAARRVRRIQGALALLPLLLAVPVAAQTAADTSALPFDPAVKVGTLPNGMRYYIQAHAVPAHRVELRLAVDVGSLLEEPQQLGVAHFVEHMAFNGSRHFAKQAIQHQLEAMGMQFGADLNAATTSDETTYRLTVPTDHPGALATGVRILADWAHGVTFDSAAVEAERGIIMGEWRLRTDAGGAEYRRTTHYLGAALAGSAYGDRLPIGDPQIIQHVSRAELVKFYTRWYRPQRMAVVVVGDVDAKAVERLVREELGTIPAGPRTQESDRAFPARTVPALAASRYVVDVDTSATIPTIAVSFRLPPRNAGRAAVRSILLQNMVAGILKERIAELDLGTSSIDRPARSVRTWSVQSSAAEDPRLTVAHLIAIPVQLVQHGVTSDEVGRARVQMLTEYEGSYDTRNAISSAQLADAYQDVYLGGGVVPSADTLLTVARENLTGLEPISVDEVNAAAKAIFDQPGVVVVAKLPRGVSLDTATIAKIADSVRHSPTPTYRDQFVSRPWFASLPAPGRVESVREIPSIGVTVWQLSNGARVVLKRTTFNPNEVQFSAAASGGVSLAADSEYIDARLGTDALQQGGFGAFSRAAIQRKFGLTGAQAGVGVVFGDVAHGLTGGGTPRDMEQLFSLVRLAFTAPRIDTAAISRWKATTRDALSQPSAKANAAFAAIRYRNDPRGRPMTAAMVDSVNPERAAAFYRSRFADASAFTFYFVGAFDPDSLRPLVEKYLANLPSTNAGSHWRDTGARQIEGPRTVEVPNGSQPGHTSVTLLLEAPSDRDSASAVRLGVVNQIAQLRLTQKLRTEMSGTYSVNVAGVVSAVPTAHSEVAVSFDADPAHADTLATAAVAVLDSLAHYGPTADEVKQVLAAYARAMELNLRSNGYWIGTLQNNGLDGFDLATGLVDPDSRVAGIDAAALRAVAAKALDTSKAVRVFFRPPVTKK